MRELEPRFGFPFAADVAILDEELFWCNEPVHNAERPTEAFAKLVGTTGPTRVVDIAPGFTVDDGQVLRNEVRRRLNADELRRAYGRRHPASQSHTRCENSLSWWRRTLRRAKNISPAIPETIGV